MQSSKRISVHFRAKPADLISIVHFRAIFQNYFRPFPSRLADLIHVGHFRAIFQTYFPAFPSRPADLISIAHFRATCQKYICGISVVIISLLIFKLLCNIEGTFVIPVFVCSHCLSSSVSLLLSVFTLTHHSYSVDLCHYSCHSSH